MKAKVDYDKKKFVCDSYGNLYPKVRVIKRSCENCKKCGETICGNDPFGLGCWERR